MQEYMGIDQWGTVYHRLGKYPRHELLERLGRKHCQRMHVDKTDGTIVHTGWIIAKRWITVYHVSPMERIA